MARDTARKLETSPNAVHYDVRRNSNGVVQMTSVTTTTGFSTTGTTTTSTTLTTLSDPDLVPFTKSKVKVSGGGGGNTATAKLTANGTTTLASTSGTGSSTTTVTGTHTTPLNQPVVKLVLTASGGSATATVSTFSREQRW